ncbi:uncharacterized protein DUF995 [Rhizobium azibense]|uniref:Uncharacterized protein DUF995 n=1 Tax=Rhizobium azibense TaxID=1136135 RepID=A0A4R3QQX1_9HYPH|nr:DUF995 domain-containing protein [Rhizobium azibense]TCU20816.1 uncharacterized protein DUF995 [Rhizobium azibense]
MRIGTRTYGASAVVLSLVLCLPGSAAAAEAKKAPVPLSAYELYQLYRNKTWTWGAGGGRFMDESRRFVAWTNDGGKQWVAEGRWAVDDLGQMCMRATWTNEEGPNRVSTCFGHRKIGRVIYQKRQPDGNWYIFRHASARAGDEYLKLVPADTVSANADAYRQKLMARR